MRSASRDTDDLEQITVNIFELVTLCMVQNKTNLMFISRQRLRLIKAGDQNSGITINRYEKPSRG